ncbi:hypothetical protein HK105_203417 [Polyrhizophydium stewartii]|uniref:Uncharacterized protein n=1 Tax=Polyrhizophydium stewartii TaxID=2732419 RepID=A0ABR4NBS3_9FUNG
MADDAAATGAAAGIALAAAHRTAPAKPPMLSKDLRLSSADLLNPLSADILQSSSTSASDYTQHDYSARSGHQASPPPGLSSSEFASADEIAMSMYGNGSAFGSGGEHGMPNQQDTHDDLLSMFRTIKGGSLSRDSTRADMLMPQLSRPPSSAGLYDYIAPTGNKTNNAWQHRELSEKRLSYESKRSSQVTLGSSMSSSDPSSLFHSSHGLMDVNSASFTSSGTAAQHRGNIRPGINPAIDSIPEEYMQSHLYDPMPPIHMADASPDLQDAATRQSEAWSLTHAFGAGDTMHPSQLIGTASFSRSFMERLGESSENNLASVPLEISQQEESISTNIRKLVQDQLNIGASETPSARSSAKQSHSDAGANATGGESTAPKQQAQGQQPMQVEKSPEETHPVGVDPGSVMASPAHARQPGTVKGLATSANTADPQAASAVPGAQTGIDGSFATSFGGSFGANGLGSSMPGDKSAGLLAQHTQTSSGLPPVGTFASAPGPFAFYPASTFHAGQLLPIPSFLSHMPHTSSPHLFQSIQPQNFSAHITPSPVTQPSPLPPHMFLQQQMQQQQQQQKNQKQPASQEKQQQQTQQTQQTSTTLRTDQTKDQPGGIHPMIMQQSGSASTMDMTDAASRFDHDGFQMQSPTAMHSIATQQQAQSFYHAQRVQGFQTPQQGSLPLLADGQSDSFARRDEAQQAMQGVHNNDGGLASPTTNIAQLEATFTHVSQQPSTFLQPHPQIGQTLPGDSMHFMTQATIPTQAMQAQLLDRSLHGVGADSHAAKRQQLRRRGSPGDALPVFSTHLLLQSTSSSPMVLPVKLQTPRLAMASTMTPAFFPQPQPQPQVGHHDEASALATHSALQAAAWGIQAGIASANAGTCSGGPVSNLMNSVGGACGRRKLIERPFYCNRCSVEIGTIFVRGNDNAAQIEALMSVSCARCESQPGRSLRNSNQSGSQLDLQSTHISNDAFSLSGGAGSGSCGAGSAGGSAGGTAMSGSDPARSASGASKKRSRSSVPTIDCEVCKRTLGIGLLARMGISPSMGGGCIRQGGKDGAGSAAFAAAQGAEDLKPEYVCKPCCQTYMFCSECGGGGKQRTGKWRPKELFERGRRTCSLPHVRVGNALVNYQVLDVSSELTPDVLNGIQDVFYDCMISLYAVPAIIQSPKYGSYVSVRADLEQLWRTSVMDFVVPGMDEGTIQLSSDGASATTSIPTQVPAYCRRFLTVAWMDKRHRNKGKGKFSVKENISWLRRIEIGQAAEMTDAGAIGGGRAMAAAAAAAAMSDGPGDAASTAAAPATGKVFGPQVSSVGPHAMLSPSPVTQTVPLPPAPPARSSSQSQMQSQSQAATSSSSASSGTPARGPAASHHTSHDDPNKSFVAFSVLEWDLRLNTIFFAQMAPRSVFLKTMGQYIDLLNVGIHRVLAEARAANLPPPQVVWCWTRSDHARLQSVPARLGFQPHQQFLSENPDVSPHIFARDDFAPLEMEGALVFAQTIQTFVSQRAPPHTVG